MYHQKLKVVINRSCCYETVQENRRKMPLIEVFFSIIALIQFVKLLRTLRNFLGAAPERMMLRIVIFLEKKDS